jgi:hypothetical protein
MSFGWIAISIAISSWRWPPWLISPAGTSPHIPEPDFVENRRGGDVHAAVAGCRTEEAEGRRQTRLRREPRILRAA